MATDTHTHTHIYIHTHGQAEKKLCEMPKTATELASLACPL